jgi:Cu2+-exporting ATPase
VLIITCPCALGLAVPVAQVVICGAMMRTGLLVKNGDALERLAQADEAFFDKTGTITLGRPEPSGLDALSSEERAIVRGLAMASRHPLAVALRQALGGADVGPATLSHIEEVTGEGVRAMCNGLPVAMRRPTREELAGLDDDLAMSVTLDLSQGRAHLICFADAVRPGAAQALAELAALGLPSAMISGDRPEAVAGIATALGIAGTGGLKPADKLAHLEAEVTAGRKPLMVGDGLNDGPALAAAHVSMAPASASDVGQQAADIVFLGDSLLAVPRAIRSARATMRIVRQNFVLAVGYNILAVPLAIAGHVTPLVAALAMSSSSLIVVANSLRLRWAAR